MKENFQKLMNETNHSTNHQRNLPLLMMEIYIAKSNLSPEFTKMFLFENCTNYNRRNDDHLQFPKVMAKRCGEENICRGYILFCSLPKEIRSSSNLSEFKQHIQLWNGNICNCRLCKIVILRVGLCKGLVLFAIRPYPAYIIVSFLINIVHV